ncbi:hypothetical protein AU195_05705 [Mycobacterium sp. IS-1496]|uniref:hypothetical protein n=1 Tax=Mycobacterium sp. IS-1496 TaxID=1772284 RepID=UPI0007417EE9|nr:hypothetical protein [Mycobacterium sp. IS-1496]KUI26502.1 hypothetical protein AU195_05705 [Mycobacterium sp. IS-1496]
MISNYVNDEAMNDEDRRKFLWGHAVVMSNTLVKELRENSHTRWSGIVEELGEIIDLDFDVWQFNYSDGSPIFRLLRLPDASGGPLVDVTPGDHAPGPPCMCCDSLDGIVIVPGVPPPGMEIVVAEPPSASAGLVEA